MPRAQGNHGPCRKVSREEQRRRDNAARNRNSSLRRPVMSKSVATSVARKSEIGAFKLLLPDAFQFEIED